MASSSFAAGALCGAAALLVVQRLRARSTPTPVVHSDDEAAEQQLAQKLLDASKEGDAEQVERLVQMGAKQTVTTDGNSPLHLVCANVKKDATAACRIIAALSTAADFDVNALNSRKYTALMYAALNNQASVVSAVLALDGVDFNAVHGNSGDTALFMAAMRQNVGAVHALASCGDALATSYYLWDGDGQTAIFWAGEYNNRELAEAILSLPGYSFVEQYRRYVAAPAPCIYREALADAVLENGPTFIAAVAAHLRRRGEATAAIVSEIFDTPRVFSTDGQQTATLVERAASQGLWRCVEELYLAGAAVTMRDLVPTIVGENAGSSMVESCCARVRERFLRDFAEGDVEVVSVEPNLRCAKGLTASFRSSLDLFSSRHGRPPPTRFLWHCSSVPEVVLETGLNGNFASMDLNVYGVGLYMATDAKLSASYARPGPDGVCTMLLVLTVLGRTGVREPLIGVEEESVDDERLKESMAKMGINLTQPQHRNPPIGCDTSTGPHSKEVVVYSSSAALPAFAVRYRLKSTSLPNPYKADTRSRHPRASSDEAQAARGGGGGAEEVPPAETAQYLRSLREVPPLLTAPTLGRASVEGEPEIVEDAVLLPTGTFPTSRQEARELRRKVIEEGFSLVDTTSLTSSRAELWSKCVRLGDEVSWLKERLGKLQQVEAENQALRMQRDLPIGS